MELEPLLLAEVRQLLKDFRGEPAQAVQATEALIAKWPWNSYLVALALALCATEASAPPGPLTIPDC